MTIKVRASRHLRCRKNAQATRDERLILDSVHTVAEQALSNGSQLHHVTETQFALVQLAQDHNRSLSDLLRIVATHLETFRSEPKREGFFGRLFR